MEISGGQSIAGCCHLLAESHIGMGIIMESIMLLVVLFFFKYLFFTLNTHESVPASEVMQRSRPRNTRRKKKCRFVAAFVSSRR